MYQEPRLKCWDCEASIGEMHSDRCDVARCIENGEQRLQCEKKGHSDCGYDIHTGYWPGVIECECYNLWSKFVDGEGWVKCSNNEPGASEDLNSLHDVCSWDKEVRLWILDGLPHT